MCGGGHDLRNVLNFLFLCHSEHFFNSKEQATSKKTLPKPVLAIQFPSTFRPKTT